MRRSSSKHSNFPRFLLVMVAALSATLLAAGCSFGEHRPAPASLSYAPAGWGGAARNYYPQEIVVRKSEAAAPSADAGTMNGDSIVTVIYPIEALLVAPVDFRPPDVDIGGDIFREDNNDEERSPLTPSKSAEGDTDFDRPDEIIDLIKTVVAPGTWEKGGGGGPGRIKYFRGSLVITQTVAAHREIARLLQSLGG